MTKEQAALTVAFLLRLSERFGNDGCNDLLLPNTPEYAMLVEAAEEMAAYSQKPMLHQGKLLTMNFLVVDYLAELLITEHALNDNDLPEIG